MAPKPRGRGTKRRKGSFPPSASKFKKPTTRIDFGFNDDDLPSDASSGRGGERIDSDEEDSDLELQPRGKRRVEGRSEDEEDESDKETADERRVRLAREFLRKAEREVESSSSSEGSSSDEDEEESGGVGVSGESDETPESDSAAAHEAKHYHDRLSRKLAKERLSRAGALSLRVASSVSSSVTKTWEKLAVDSRILSPSPRLGPDGDG